MRRAEMQGGQLMRYHAVALLLITLAAGGCSQRTSNSPRPLLLPALAAEQDQLDRIQLFGARQTLLVELQRQHGQWSLVQRGHWAADAGRISQYLFVLSQARQVEARTDDPRLYARLGVEPVSEASATGTELRLHGGRAWPRLIIGHEHARFDSNYVRFADQKQAWLTDLPVTFNAQPSQWLDPRLLDIPIARIASVQVHDRDGGAFSLRSQDDRFRLDDAPSAAMHDSHAGDSLAATLDHLRLEDVASDDPGVPWERELRFTMVDGQVWTLQGWHVDARLWIRVLRSVDTGVASQWAARVTPTAASKPRSGDCEQRRPGGALEGSTLPAARDHCGDLDAEPRSDPRRHRQPMMTRLANALAAFTCAASVALGAYASHAAQAQARQRIGLAALFAFAHALSLLQLSPRSSGLARVGRCMLALGTLLFSGSLAMAGLFDTSTAAAPFGGTLLILGWLVIAADFARAP